MTPVPTDAELDAMEAELRRDLESAIVDLLLLQMRAVHEPPVDLATSSVAQPDPSAR
jgi:hypothetical protein